MAAGSSELCESEWCRLTMSGFAPHFSELRACEGGKSLRLTQTPGRSSPGQRRDTSHEWSAQLRCHRQFGIGTYPRCSQNRCSTKPVRPEAANPGLPGDRFISSKMASLPSNGAAPCDSCRASSVRYCRKAWAALPRTDARAKARSVSISFASASAILGSDELAQAASPHSNKVNEKHRVPISTS